MSEIFLAILAAGICASGSAFQLAPHIGPHKFNYRRRDRSSWSPLFRTPTDASTVAYNREYLSQTLGIREEKLDILSRKAWNILTLDIGVLERRVHWLKRRLSLKENEVKNIAQQLPIIFQFQPDNSLAPKLEYLQERLLLEENSLRKLILTHPRVLGYSIEDNIEPKLDWLQQRLGLDDAAVSKVIARYPTILGLNVDENIDPKLDWLQQRLDLDDVAVSRMIQRMPSLFSYNIDTNLEPTLDWLQQRLDLDDAAASKMIKRLPALFGCSIDTNLEPKLEWLQKHLDLDDDAVSKLIQQQPTLLGYNVENLAPTLNFYIDALGNKEGALALVVRYPSLFGYSLDKRLKPRLEHAQDIGLVINAGCLRRIAKYTNDQWQKSLLFQEQGWK